MTDLTGRTLGNYEILSLLGEGGMATVYRARQTNIQRYVAIKVIKATSGNIEQFAQRFEREVQTIAALNHPHIIKVFDYGHEGNLAYLVMEYQPGGSLADLVEKGAVPFARASKLLDQIASALDYAHRQGIAHRDLKPQNVLLDADGNAILTDFGLAKVLNADSSLTQSGTVMGTPAYMSPEQWQGTAIDSRADIYALGILVFEMLTGKLPFTGDTPFNVMHKHIYDQPPSINGYRPELPFAIDQVIKKALAKDRDQRYATAGEFAQAFKTVSTGQAAATPSSNVLNMGATSAALPNNPTTQLAAAANPPARSNAALIVFGVGIIALILIIGGYFASKQGARTETVVAAAVTSTPLPPTTAFTATVAVKPTLAAITAPTTALPTTAVPAATKVPPTVASSATLDNRQTVAAQQTAQQANLNLQAQSTNLAITVQAVAALQTQIVVAAQQTATGQAAIRNAQSTTLAITPTATKTLSATTTPIPTQTTAPSVAPTTAVPVTAAPVLPTTLPAIGQVTFADKNKDGRVNQLTMTINNIPLAGEGKQYEAWISDREHAPVSLGKLTVKADKTALLTYNDPKGANLLLTYSVVFITVQGKDLNPPGAVAYSGTIPPLTNVHVQHVIARFPDTPANIGLMNGALQQYETLSEHVSLLNDAVKSNSLSLVKLHMEHIFNIMTGKDGAKDINGDGKLTISPPGDGFGLFNYLTNAVEHAELAATQPDVTDAIKVSGEHVAIAAANATTTLTQMQTLILEASEKKTLAEMKPLLTQVIALNPIVLNGTPDASGKITPTKGSGGLALAYAEGMAMATIPIVPGDAATKAVQAIDATTVPPLPPTATQSAVESGATVIVMANMEFAPKTITIKAGSSVVFSNQDDVQHTGTADNDAFDTDVLDPGTRSKPIKFDKPGTYPFYCEFHGGPGGVGMSGVIIVQ